VIERYKPALNIAIVLVLAAAVDVLPGGGRAANTVGAVLSVGFAAGIAYFVGRLYLEHRVSVYGLGDRHRALLYGSVAVGIVTITAEPRMWQSSAGKVLWFVILAAVIYALVTVYRFSRTY
jgi:hypothetical protein